MLTRAFFFFLTENTQSFPRRLGMTAGFHSNQAGVAPDSTWSTSRSCSQLTVRCGEELRVLYIIGSQCWSWNLAHFGVLPAWILLNQSASLELKWVWYAAVMTKWEGKLSFNNFPSCNSYWESQSFFKSISNLKSQKKKKKVWYIAHYYSFCAGTVVQ